MTAPAKTNMIAVVKMMVIPPGIAGIEAKARIQHVQKISPKSQTAKGVV